jgi:4-amino-4-deoxy-L-arabinose transferase-like glycosyltransferase
MNNSNQPLVRPKFWILLFTLIGFGLRVQQLGFQPLWGDEGWSFYFAAQPVGQLLALTAIDIHPPLYYLLLKGWLALAGPGPEAARFLSVGCGVMLIPVVGVLGRRFFDGRTAAAGAGVTALMPLAVYYAQEVRMYGLVTLLAALSTYAFTRAHQKRWQAAHIAVTAAALYTMYYAAFVPLFQLVEAIIRHRRNPRRAGFIAMLRPFLWVGLLYLPWLIYAGPRLVSYVQNKRAVEGYLPLNFIRFMGDHLAAFSLGHLPPGLKPYVWAALPFVIAAALGLAAMLTRHRRRGLYLSLYLLIPLLAGYVVNQVYPFTPPYYERTLLLAAPAFWLLIGAGIIRLWDRQYLLVGTVVIAMLLAVTVSLLGFYTTPRYPHQDYRPLLKDIAARATPADTLLASYQWQLGFYHAYLPAPRPALFAVPGWGQGYDDESGRARLTTDLTRLLGQSPRLWFPAHQALGHIWEDAAEEALAHLGYPTLLEWYSPQTKLTLAGGAEIPMESGPTANFNNLLSLQSIRVGRGPFAAGRDIVPVALLWQKQANLGQEHRVSLRLVDAAGRTWASRDSHPQAGQAFFTDMAPGDTLPDRHGLLTPAGAPPGRYRLLLSVRRVADAHPLDLVNSQNQPLGAELTLAEIELTPPRSPLGPHALPVQTRVDSDFGGWARLLGYSLGSGPFKAGEALPLTLFWQVMGSNLPPLTVLVELQDESGLPVGQYQQPPAWPSPQWQAGDLLRDPHAIPLPPTLPPGQYRLAVSLFEPGQNPLTVPLGVITTLDRPHNFDPPQPEFTLDVLFGNQARLVGLDLPARQVKPGESLPLTLHWQAQATLDQSWTVFVHLLDAQGNIISQQDQIPGGGQFPTTGWLPGEYLTDSYSLLIPANTPPGREVYRLAVGLYNANDFTRLPVLQAGEFVADHVVLESWPITVP